MLVGNMFLVQDAELIDTNEIKQNKTENNIQARVLHFWQFIMNNQQ